ncbi:excinuclease ABC subunit UvrB [Mycoplasma bradburyae]|uniref:UvrABC system protein B n=1 Tax=Mycoplasma bradburyae TaxID=2963128 RepID=A0ABT5GA84_9MOLU|nr:excinuclease ABC subunit UvrB [Mycoplasma bradburyae]MDC4181872.1 excinuclease ABC subunit B [Mycoplasma bradburyae]MDC4182571.1 excinuclease ABC subunit B [Mycoplasma bradburyae]UTS70171.1 excinuclease ABC subunit UvrB [Mycoplasma bradburyae]UTS70895.1 excinuclease ABC subunit UvrB [Mycoplasma bradburyae]
MEKKFKLVSKNKPAGHQPEAIKKLVEGVKNKKKYQTLLGATGTGKTFTIANVIEKTQKKTLILAHNKTLAAQLYLEFKELFPNNAVEYFVSYFDFYQPEAYIPRSDMYIEKSSVTNDEIEMLRLASLNSLTTRNDVIVVASVACIYPAANPADFDLYRIILKVNNTVKIGDLKENLVRLNYVYNPDARSPGTFRVRGDVVEIFPGYVNDHVIRLSFFGDELEEIAKIHPVDSTVIEKYNSYVLGPANEYILNFDRRDTAIKRIQDELMFRIQEFKKDQKLIEAQRIEQRTEHDIDSIKEFGFCNGIENYAFHLELREKGSTPWTLFDFFGDDWLMVIDESHISVPQVKGMYNTDKSRKTTLVEYGFRLPSALENRPLNYDEFSSKADQVIFVSATPNQEEIELSDNEIIEQIVRPTGLLDPTIEVRSRLDQITDLMNELRNQKSKNERTFITVTTIKMAEDLTEYLKERNFKCAYIHNELKTLERSLILNDLRRGKYDCVIGINLLREGLDIPEVSLVCIFDADKPGYFRSDKALIQTIGRAARNENGRVIMYADEMTNAMKIAIDETNRRREIQIEFNKKHKITPKTIVKPIYDDLKNKASHKQIEETIRKTKAKGDKFIKMIDELRKDMLEAAKNQNYEEAASLRDLIIELETNQLNKNNK